MKVTIDINETLRANGLTTVGFQDLHNLRQQALDAQLLIALPDKAVLRARKVLPSSRGQLRQDVVALAYTNFKKAGYFVEFGATNGVLRSNTLILERNFGWTGILCEPGRRWETPLRNAREAIIDTDCVWSTTGRKLDFRETQDGELSTLEQFADKDSHAARRAEVTDSYKVKTVSLKDLLDRHGAPKDIDYLSIDTEGSEYAILKAFDWDAYRFQVITCEHNHTADRAKIHTLLSQAGYTRVHEDISDFDDWYVADTAL